MNMLRKSLFFCIQLIILHSLYAQKPESFNAAELQLRLNRLNTLGSVLYVAAHPDDENTRLIAWLSKEKLYNTAYLSLTRGDGGQNLIGPEIRETLGMIRTHELLAARRIDGGRQFFSRANDFGYSKTAEETFHIWDSVQVMSDVVWAIRQFRPDVIITRFNSETGGGHGHHTASAMLAEKAFHLAADSNVFPEQLQHVEPWQPQKLLWNTSRWFYSDRDKFDSAKMVIVNVGGYSPLLGKSYTEIAAEARSMHRSQGFGSSTSRGDAYEYLMPVFNARAGEELFQGIDVSWNRIPGGFKIGRLVEEAISHFAPEDPQKIVPILLNARKELNGLPDSYWKRTKSQELDQIIKGCMGLFMEATTSQSTVVQGEAMKISLETINRSAVPATLRRVRLTSLGKDTLTSKTAVCNQSLRFEITGNIGNETPLSQPYWLREAGSEGMYRVEDQRLRGLPEESSPVYAEFVYAISGQDFTFRVPVVFKEIDPAVGEIYKPLRVIPPVFVRAERQVYVFTDSKPDSVHITVTAGKDDLSAVIVPETPAGWKISPSEIAMQLEQKGQETVVAFRVTAPDQPSSGELRINAQVDSKTYSYSYTNVNYDHIPQLSWFPEAKSRIVKIDLEKKGSLIGYVAGAGDAVAESLRWIGYEVRYLTDADFKNNNLLQYDAIILGVRAYNVNERLKYYQELLFDYVKKGGVVISQYNVDRGLVVDNPAPYPLRLSRERVTDEQAEVKILAPGHPAMNTPNKVSKSDFEGWVQERGLYFANEWDSKFTPLLSSHDEGEDPLHGGLLAARYGDGYFVYTGYSWFRQLPAGVPGAFRILANLIALGKTK